jgi:hypothetical protein
VWLVVDRAKKAGLDWATVESLDDAALEARVHPLGIDHPEARRRDHGERGGARVPAGAGIGFLADPMLLGVEP